MHAGNSMCMFSKDSAAEANRTPSRTERNVHVMDTMNASNASVDSIPPVREAREATTTVCGHSIRIFLFILGGHGECVREDELWER